MAGTTTERRSGRIDLNRATVDELEQIEGVDHERSSVIVEWRAEHGPFKSWEDLQAIPGIGDRLVQKVKQRATLGDGDQEARGEGQDEGDAADAQDVEIVAAEVEEADDVEDEVPMEALDALCLLDQQAADAYRFAAESVDDETLRQMLMQFGDDHDRHVEQLSSCMAQMGGQARKPQRNANDLLPALVAAAAPEGPAAIIATLIANEHVTNTSYEVALSVAEEQDDLLDVIAQAHEDEQRHLAELERVQGELEPDVA